MSFNLFGALITRRTCVWVTFVSIVDIWKVNIFCGKKRSTILKWRAYGEIFPLECVSDAMMSRVEKNPNIV